MPKETTKSKIIQIELPISIYNKLQESGKKRDLSIDDYIRISLRALSRRSKYFNLEDEITFGKYEGEKLETIIKTDPTYVVWCTKNIEGFLISDSAEEMLIEILHEDGIEVGPNLYKIMD